ncbi:MAG: hypothetical protein RR505_07305 [Raoultibacter sp.]
MDFQAIAEQVVGAVQESPEKISELMADPQGAIEQITGMTLGEGDLAGVMEQIQGMLGGSGIDIESIIGSIGCGIGEIIGGFFGGFKK